MTSMHIDGRELVVPGRTQARLTWGESITILSLRYVSMILKWKGTVGCPFGRGKPVQRDDKYGQPFYERWAVSRTKRTKRPHVCSARNIQQQNNRGRGILNGRTRAELLRSGVAVRNRRQGCARLNNDEEPPTQVPLR